MGKNSECDVKCSDTQKKQLIRNIYTKVRHVYILIYMFIVASVAMIPVRLATDGKMGIVYMGLAGVGFLLLLTEFYLHISQYRNWSGILRILFMCACVISMVANMKYGITDNIKTLCWTGIQIFVLMAVDTELSTVQIIRQFRQFSEAFSFIWSVGVLLSLRLFILQYSNEYWLMDSVTITREGFTEGRLFGVFTDPNYAALCSCAVIFFAICNILLGRKKILSIIYHAIIIFMQVSYVILSGSRTAQVGIIFIVFAVALLLIVKCCISKKMNMIWKVVIPFICACVAVVICFFGWKVLKKGYSYVPEVYASIFENKKEITIESEGLTEGEVITESEPVTEEEVVTESEPVAGEEIVTESEPVAGEEVVTENEPVAGEEVVTENAPATEVEVTTENEVAEIGEISFIRDDVEDTDDISNNRFSIWKDYIEVFKTTPIVGTSPRNALKYAEDHFTSSYIVEMQYSVHNTYLALFVCTGLIGGILMMLWLLLTAARVIKYLVVHPMKQPGYYVILMLTCIVVIYAIAAFPLMFMFFNNMIVDIVFWVTLGFLMALIKKYEKEIK